MRTLHQAEKLRADDIIRLENGTMMKVRHYTIVEVADFIDMITGVKCVYRLGEIELTKNDILDIGDEHNSVVGCRCCVIDENVFLHKVNVGMALSAVAPGSFFTRKVDEFALRAGPYTDDELFAIGWDHGFFEKTANSPIGENENYKDGKESPLPFYCTMMTIYAAGYFDGRFDLQPAFPCNNEYCDGYESGQQFKTNILKGE